MTELWPKSQVNSLINHCHRRIIKDGLVIRSKVDKAMWDDIANEVNADHAHVGVSERQVKIGRQCSYKIEQLKSMFRNNKEVPNLMAQIMRKLPTPDTVLNQQDPPLDQPDPPLDQPDPPLDQPDPPLDQHDPPLNQSDLPLNQQDTPLNQQDPLLNHGDTIIQVDTVVQGGTVNQGRTVAGQTVAKKKSKSKEEKALEEETRRVEMILEKIGSREFTLTKAYLEIEGPVNGKLECLRNAIMDESLTEDFVKGIDSSRINIEEEIKKARNARETINQLKKLIEEEEEKYELSVENVFNVLVKKDPVFVFLRSFEKGEYSEISDNQSAGILIQSRIRKSI